MLTQDGELTDIGSWYMGGVATNNVPDENAASTLVRGGSWALVVAVASLVVYVV
jgi:hypothetical protein